MLRSAATNISKLLVVSVAIAAAVITAVSVHSIYPVEDPITPIGYLDRQVGVDRHHFARTLHTFYPKIFHSLITVSFPLV